MYQREGDMRPAPPTHVSVPPEPGGAPAGFSTQMPMGQPAYRQPPSGNSNGRNGLIAAVVVLAIALVGVVGYVVFRGDDEQADDRATPSTEVVNERERPSRRERTAPEPTDASDNEPLTTETPDTEAPFEDTPATEPPFADEPVGELTESQGAAAVSARSYLDTSPMSRAYVISLLTIDGEFTEEDAAIGVDSLNVDWYEQASLQAPEVLGGRPVSRQGLIDDMSAEYVGYTVDEATYGVDSMGTDWDYQAVSAATTMSIESPDLACDDMRELMTDFYKFTPEQAEYGTIEAGVC